MDDSLLCDEVLDFSALSAAASPPPAAAEQRPRFVCSTAAAARNDFEEAVGFLVEKEMRYMPKPGYVNHLQSNTLIYHARYKAIRWIIQAQKRLNNVSLESVFYAANYLDRFISLDKCQGWSCCTFDLLSLACLYVASKFNETNPPSLPALQMEGVGHPPFGSNMIVQMEMKLLQALEWKLLSTTTYSYLQLTMETLQDEFNTRATHMLLQTLLDPKFVEFRPSLVAESVVRFTLDPQEKDKQYFSALIPQVEKDDIMKKIHEMMEKGEEEEEEAETWEKKEEDEQYYCCSGDCPTLKLEDLNIIDDGSTRKRKR
ncbi:PREDICTED: cyclin-D4-2-like [Ipomoea nil]|uniref:cyclin-D4-2-like n=1 Tax=Ipomoea nil TaxID=35883 RepID=UPI00090186AB|nr:PREDICTED: cyclin-D4-2-like [Ipomoea nil]